MKIFKLLVLTVVFFSIQCLTASAQKKTAVFRTKQSAKPVRLYNLNSRGNCYYTNSKQKKIYVMPKYCREQTPEEITNPAPAHKILPGTKEIETNIDDPLKPNPNPNEPEPVVPKRVQPKSKKPGDK